MEIGYHLPTTQPARDTREALVAFARAAEERGAASLWVSDHVVIPRETAGYPGGRQFPVPPERPYLEPITALGSFEKKNGPSGRIAPGFSSRCER